VQLQRFLIINYLGEQYKYTAILIMTPFILVFRRKLSRKTVYRYHAEEITPYLAYPIKVLSILFYPLVIYPDMADNTFYDAFWRGQRSDSAPRYKGRS